MAIHGIPDERPLEDGDIISVDVTVFKNGYHGDCCATFPVGKIDEAAVRLLAAARAALYRGIAACAAGSSFAAVGKAIYGPAVSDGYHIPFEYVGHGIGKYFHCGPPVFHVPLQENIVGGKMKRGQAFTIEPLVLEKCVELEEWDDNWTTATEDGSRTAQYEHTVLVTDAGVRIMTL